MTQKTEQITNKEQIFQHALERIAGGFIDSDFVMQNPPDWYTAYSQLQLIARKALAAAAAH